MSAAPKAKKKGKRYTAEEKTDILAFVEKFNTENGRGGQTAAKGKYGVSSLSLAAWMKAGKLTAGPGNKSGQKAASQKGAKGSTFARSIKAITVLGGQIEKAEADLAKLQAKFRKLVNDL